MSTKHTHTPGPWTDVGLDGQSDGYVWADGEIVCSGWDTPRGRADARLISAAPEMLAALEALVFHVGDGQYVSRSHIADAIAAIAKARGI